ncbi:WXG100 family type VII secretion target [Actinoplanes sp. TFC3]|uniref:WXG100 family type VII secretion target n=1 Tax=Actinoplanes sp. TFC3 TaxID=1710355 RepID=UPI000B0F2E49|nr:WXG100 family type VII secretion target [Actinoplanes sp. TFC3]
MMPIRPPLVAVANPGISTDPWAGVWIAEDVETILAGIRDGSWIDTTLGAVSAGLDALAFVSDPIGSLLQYGVAWIIEHVKPLSEALDWLAGNPGQIAAHAQTWRNIARELDGRASDLDRTVHWDTTEWQGTAADAYRTWTGQQKDAVTALAGAAETMAAITEGAGKLVSGVRMMVRDAIAVLVSRLITYAAEEVSSFGLATPLVVEQVSTLCASWGARIAKWLRGLVSSLEHLRGLTGKLGEAIEAIKGLLRRLQHDDTASLDRVKKRGAGAIQLFTEESVRNVAAKYGIDISNLSISLGSKATRGICGRTLPDGSIVLFPTGFRSEEDLARTLAHERFHHDELESGKLFPKTAEEFDAFEDRAYAYEEQWWENQPIRPEPKAP